MDKYNFIKLSIYEKLRMYGEHLVLQYIIRFSGVNKNWRRMLMNENLRPHSDHDTFLSVNEVAVLLNVSKSTIFAWSKEGVMPKQKKFGRCARWSRKGLEEWINTLPQGAYGKGGNKKQ